VGIPTAGQALVGGKALVGHCVNFLPIRVGVGAESSFADLALAVREALLDAFDHQDFTYYRLLTDRDLPRESGRSPLVSVSFNLHPDVGELRFGDLKCDLRKNPKHFVNFELHWNIVESSGGYALECEFDTDLFDAGTIESWADAYLNFLGQICDRPQIPIAE